MIQTQSIDDSTINTRISSKHQVVVPAKIRKSLKLQAGDRLSWRIIKVGNKSKILAEPQPKNWAEYSLGLGKNIWKNIDIDEYINNLRDEWER